AYSVGGVLYGLCHRPRDGSVVSSLHCMNDPQPEGHMASHIGRRKFLATLGGTAAWPLAARAQQRERMRRVAVLMSVGADDAEGQSRVTAFAQGLQELGWSEGRNLRVEYRWAAGNADNIRKHAAELVAIKPDVIVGTGTPTVTSLAQATRTVPVVFVQVAD